MLKIWSAFLVKKFWKLLISLLVLAFSFYTIVHYSLHSLKGSSSDIKVNFLTCFEYYFSQTVLNLEFILPQLITITTIIVLSSMQNKREVVFLRASGLSLKKFVRPLILSSFLLSFLLYLNFQWLYPYCEDVISKQQKKSSTSTSLVQKEAVPVFYLKNQTRLLCSNLDVEQKMMESVIWIKNPQEIYRMTSLSFFKNIPLGKEVFVFLKNKEKEFVLENYFPEFSTEEIEFEIYDNPFSKIFLNKNRNKLISLYKSIPWKVIKYGCYVTNLPRLSQLISQFFYKLFSPLACIIATIIPIRYCLTFNRIQLFSLSYLISLGTLNLFFICLKSAIVLTNSHIFPACFTMAIPTCLVLIFTGYQYCRIK